MRFVFTLIALLGLTGVSPVANARDLTVVFPIVCALTQNTNGCGSCFATGLICPPQLNNCVSAIQVDCSNGFSLIDNGAVSTYNPPNATLKGTINNDSATLSLTGDNNPTNSIPSVLTTTSGSDTQTYQGLCQPGF